MTLSPPALLRGAAAGLRRVNLNRPHWHQARWLLAGEAAAGVLAGGTGLLGVALSGDSGFRVLGVALTPWLSAVLLGVGAAAITAAIHRRAALIFSAAASASAVALMVICAVAAAHHDPGPLGFTAPAILLWAVLFCYNLGLGMWLIPDQIEGPAWVPRRRPTHRADPVDPAGRSDQA